MGLFSRKKKISFWRLRDVMTTSESAEGATKHIEGDQEPTMLILEVVPVLLFPPT